MGVTRVVLVLMVVLVALQGADCWFRSKDPQPDDGGPDAPTKNNTIHAKWEAFKAKYSKKFSDAADAWKKAVFQRTLDYIKTHNKRFNQGMESYEMGTNEFSDTEYSDFNLMMNGFKWGRHGGNGWFPFPGRPGTPPPPPSPAPPGSLPATVDWRQEGYVTPVKNQGQCGSCWSFSTTGAMEGQVFKKTGNLISMSEQNLVDCSGYPNQGCNGGNPAEAVTFITKEGGIDTEASYPYKGVQGSCHYSASNSAATAVKPVPIHPTESALQQAVAKNGPISVAIDATRSFQSYKSGVYNNPRCGTTPNHAVLVVGYGTDSQTGLKYWLVKNSWGTSWGENGYVKMARDQNDQCAIASMTMYPQV